MRENELCLKQKTDSCEGCPVLSILRDELRNDARYNPRDRSDLTSAAVKVGGDNCPEGLLPDINQLIVERKGNGWTGKYEVINVR